MAVSYAPIADLPAVATEGEVRPLSGRSIANSLRQAQVSDAVAQVEEAFRRPPDN